MGVSAFKALMSWQWSAVTIISLKGNGFGRLKFSLEFNFFLWRCYRKSIGVNTCLNARGVDISSICPLCHPEPETIIHDLCDCMVVKPIWNPLGRGQSDQTFYGSELPEWLEINGKENHTYPPNLVPWRYVFLLAI